MSNTKVPRFLASKCTYIDLAEKVVQSIVTLKMAPSLRTKQ